MSPLPLGEWLSTVKYLHNSITESSHICTLTERRTWDCERTWTFKAAIHASCNGPFTTWWSHKTSLSKHKRIYTVARQAQFYVNLSVIMFQSVIDNVKKWEKFAISDFKNAYLHGNREYLFQSLSRRGRKLWIIRLREITFTVQINRSFVSDNWIFAARSIARVHSNLSSCCDKSFG